MNDPKVRYELGEGGAPEEAGNIALEYEAMAKNLSGMGFNGGMLDLMAGSVRKQEFPA